MPIRTRRDRLQTPGLAVSTRPRRSLDKCLERQEFIILGYIPSTAASRSVGSLALGYHDNQNLVYAGRVGTGWSQEQARMLRDELEAFSGTKPSFAKPLPAGAEKGVRWVEPRLVCEIEYRGWTGDDKMRSQCVFLALSGARGAIRGIPSRARDEGKSGSARGASDVKASAGPKKLTRRRRARSSDRRER
jgi:ATP dependent DNA ligase C terminal region